MLATGGSALCAINVSCRQRALPHSAQTREMARPFEHFRAQGPNAGAPRRPQVLKDAGVPEDRILFINVVTCPEGARAMANGAPQVKIVTAAMDEGLNADKYIVPGLGDFGDRYFATM